MGAKKTGRKIKSAYKRHKKRLKQIENIRLAMVQAGNAIMAAQMQIQMMQKISAATNSTLSDGGVVGADIPPENIFKLSEAGIKGAEAGKRSKEISIDIQADFSGEEFTQKIVEAISQ